MKGLKSSSELNLSNPLKTRASGELALDSCPYQAAGIINSYLLAVSGVTHALCACNQSEFVVVIMVMVVVKIFSLLRAASSPHQNRGYWMRKSSDF